MTRTHLSRASRVALAALAPLLWEGCRGPAATARPEPAPAAAPAAEPAPAPTPAGADTARARRGYAEADARFMRRMLAHHGQALVMTALVPERTRRDDLRLLAERIDVSQRDEIAAMQRWLRARGEPAPDPAAHGGHVGHEGAMPDMPGMATPAELQALAALSGAAFDARFLELMIRHHEGALAMVAELFAARGAGQDPQVFTFATDVDADQRAEIARLRALRARLPNE